MNQHNMVANALVYSYSSIQHNSNASNKPRPKDLPTESFSYITSSDCHLAAIYDYLDMIHPILHNKDTIKVCDLGSGDGLLLSYIGAYIKGVHNIDAILQGVEYSREYISCSYRVYIDYLDFFKLPASYIRDLDIIYSYNPLHIAQRNIELLQRTIRCMKPGAHLIFTCASRMLKELKSMKFVEISDSTYYFVK